jgi:hypothetical protein
MAPPQRKKSRVLHDDNEQQQQQQQPSATTFLDVAGLVLDRGVLPWYEASLVGAANKELRAVWKEREATYDGWDKLLALLNRMNAFNKCRYCQEAIFPASESQCTCSSEERGIRGDAEIKLDPRSEPTYDALPTHVKCRELVQLTGLMVENFRTYIQYDEEGLTEEDCLPNGYGDWEWFFPDWAAFHEKCPKRSAFMRILIAHAMASGDLSSDVYRFESAFFGAEFDPNTGSSFNNIASDCYGMLLPGKDEDLKQYILSEYKMETTRLLGPVLTQDLLFFAPFVENGEVVLPFGLE